MARTLNEFLVSTGNYTYEITDANMVGIDIGDLEIAAILHCNLSNGGEIDVLVCSRKNIDTLFKINQEHIFCNPSYCKNVGNGKFIISLPFWRLQYLASLGNDYVISADFEIVLFGFSTLERPIGNDNGKTSFQCIIIDNGTIEFTKNRFPLPLATLKEKEIV